MFLRVRYRTQRRKKKHHRHRQQTQKKKPRKTEGGVCPPRNCPDSFAELDFCAAIANFFW